ncbi:membrane protein YfiH [Mycobacteroides abscessus]|uniref:Purine nucleoside phosphorylase n=3 Tax=Mycobacteroides abscessus TaxID=36809 RepID=A0A829HWU5_9MYCO|nr:peptidoglycan editing factor PgeF [Mycobacteroides abscessus]ESV59833.1 multi-copper polyphenol oxidoreductase laccase family protein [Mycobacteroides abscessus MAB_082312_2258]ESV63126.1 multi-copper polyphenol oxidoreductase laccase family protein [Mycobacteroides abscessus MAB_091912_2446]AIC72340.1 laccase [Mycobacteroides abscessus subsp. massiliense str. GO 06]AMU25731.1 laccase [Mycobacteroides abscessus]AMU35458.1 laccase [Mycobacteroides abscessus]
MGFRVRRVTTTRRGGVSRAPFDSFNLGDHVGDDPGAVAANRSRLAAALGVPDDHVIWMQQVHGDHVHLVEGPGTSTIPETDALVTTEPGIALAVLTADCVPVLFADAAAGVVAGAHAGRVGAKLGIVPRTIDAMVAAGAQAERISAFLGPAVSGRHYEVPADMAADVEQSLPGSRTTTSAGTPGLDLRAGIARQLSGLGVRAIDIDPRCTVEDPDLFSYRREPRTGRLASVIWLG